MRCLLIAALVAALAGCSLVPKPETLVTDTFCLTAKKRIWSIEDSPESIRDAEAWNTAIDKRCSAKVKTS